jgi:endo-1,4-beta-D-glucanase Y
LTPVSGGRGRRQPAPCRHWLLVTVALVLAAGAVACRARRTASPADRARAASQAFLGAYLDAGGRVVRRDQGGDTVSEGQAYAMLVAAAIGDRQRFDLAWQWAKANLQRPDGLLSWRWEGGRVVDVQPASDADLDAARALLVAADRFGVAGYRHEALRIAEGILGAETVDAAGRPLLVAGPWATTPPRYVNPSYVSPAGFAALRRASGQGRWDSLAASGREVLGQLTASGPGLPPDWAVLDAGGTVHPSPPPGGNGAPAYSYDAARTFVRMAEDCSGGGRQWAGRAWPFFKSNVGTGAGGPLAATYDLGGHAQGNGSHPVAYVAAAGAAIGAGAHAAGLSLLDRAESAQAMAPSYYGAAWVALGRIMLTTDWLGGCAG